MVTGNLNYPFANSMSSRGASGPHSSHGGPEPSCTGFGTPIGEIAVDHDSVSRLLQYNPASLVVILDELNDALQRSLEENSAVLALAELPDDVIHHT